MTLTEARKLAISLMREHDREGKLDGWRFEFDNAIRRAGLCSYRRKVISLSRHFVTMNDAGQVTDTILHEIAHVLAGPAAKHGYQWKVIARSIGCSSDRCYDAAEVAMPAPKWIGVCECGACRVARDRLTDRIKRATCRHCGSRLNFQRSI